MYPEERKSKILDLMKKKGRVSVLELPEQLKVSIATVRRDLSSLQRDGFIRRRHGEAVLKKRTLLDTSYQERETKFIREKQIIAKKTIEFIEEGDHLFFNDGTTINQIAKIMAQDDFRLSVTVMTNSIRAADILLSNPRIEVLFIGGSIMKFSYACSGPLAELVLDHLKADKAIIGADAFDPRRGVSIELLPEAGITRKMIALAEKTIVVGDSSKINTRALMRVCNWNEVDVFITDSIRPQDQSLIEQYHVLIPEVPV